jgi:hypothetical protein
MSKKNTYTVYFHLRKLIESSKSKKTKPFIYSEMPFSTAIGGEGKKNPRVDLAVVILKKETLIDLLAVIEVKHYDFHANSIGIQKDLDHSETLRKGIYYPYSKSPTKLRARRESRVDQTEWIHHIWLSGKKGLGF